MIVAILGGCLIAFMGLVVLIGVKMQRPTIVGPTQARDRDVEPIEASDGDMSVLAMRALTKRGIYQASFFTSYSEEELIRAWANLDEIATWAAQQPGKRWRYNLLDWIAYYRRKLEERIAEYERYQRVNALEARLPQ